MNNFIRVLVYFALSFASVSSYGADIGQLLKSGDVEIKAWLSDSSLVSKDSHVDKDNEADLDSINKKKSSANFAVNEQIILYIEVATPRWFTGGTRISSIEIPNVVAKQRNQLATNFTERRVTKEKGAQTWSHQRWEITLYPQDVGQYWVPQTSVRVQVSAPDGSNVTGELYTQPLNFNAKRPSGLLANEDVWVSASDLKLEQQWSQSNQEETLKVGDAITRTVTVSGSDTLAMLIPTLIPTGSDSGYQHYTQPNQLSDTQVRGNYRSTRTEESVYVLQDGGEIYFPAVDIMWWNTQTQQLETLSVEGRTYQVHHTVQSFIQAYWQWFAVGICALILLLSCVILMVRYYQTHPLPSKVMFYRALKAGNSPQARVLLFRHLRKKTDLLELKQYELNQPSKGAHQSKGLQQNEANIQWKGDAQEFQSKSVSFSLGWRIWRKIKTPGGRVGIADNRKIENRIRLLFMKHKILPSLDSLRMRLEKDRNKE
ncbi:BatD family protein [Vibrio gallaecicus]|uniref:BatD family protein n=1 Tax=Vibrio gallaecicus TaxID=552386 RepID=A0ABV4N928_9VIBR|nr:BatD family protein [Vibrio gallaecicus]MDN3616603.1 BatD family protein [Vibrio gallaecicus]